jgi:hypothetical protein
MEVIEKLIWEVERRPHWYNKKWKEYINRNLKDKLWYEVCESEVTNWSELPAEQKSEKKYVKFLVHIIGYHVDDINIFCSSVHTTKKNAEALVAASEEIGLEVNADKTKYLVMS